MEFAGAMVDVLRDWKRIAGKPRGGGAGRLALWRSHVRLAAMSLLGRKRSPLARILGYRVEYLDFVNLRHLYQELFVRRFYEVALATPAPVIFDCGSNIGMSILFFKDLYPRARIKGFEPHPEVFATLTRNIERNALAGVELHQKALGDRRGTVQIFGSSEEPGALDIGMFAANGSKSAIEVEADVLSNYVDGPVDLLKLDVEGAEEIVLAELAESGKLRSVQRIVCEYHHHLDPDRDRLSRTLATLEEAGFGYQIVAHCERPVGENVYQDVVLYAYRKAARPS